MSTENLEKAHEAELQETKEVNDVINKVVEKTAENVIENVIQKKEEIPAEGAVNIILEAVNNHKDHPLVKAVLEKVRMTLHEKAERFEDEHSLFKVLKVVMESIETEKMQEMSKKRLAESVIKALVKESEMSDERKKICLDLVDSGTIGDTIDLVIAATKGELAINKKTRKRILACLGKCINSSNK